MRPHVAVALALLALAPFASALVMPAGDAARPEAAEEPTRLALDVTGWLDRTVAVPMAGPFPEDARGIGPGALLLATVDGTTYLCTANWLWRDGDAWYLGAAGHCFLPEDGTSTHGAGRDHDASGVRVRVCVARCAFGGQLGFVLVGETVELGQVAYARQTRGGFDIGNDFGVVRIPDALLPLARPGLPVWGRAAGVGALETGELACHYGNAAALGETFLSKARLGAGILTLPDGSWRAATASYQGDSGAAVAVCGATSRGLEARSAVGLLTHLSATGVAGTTIPRAQALAAEAGLALAPSL